MRSKVMLVAALWAVVMFAITGVYRMFGSPVDYMAFVFWVVVIVAAFVPAIVASYQLALMVVNPNDDNPEDYDLVAQIEELRALRADSGVLFHDANTCFVYWKETHPSYAKDYLPTYWVELHDTSGDELHVMDRVQRRGLTSVFSWIHMTAFIWLDEEHLAKAGVEPPYGDGHLRIV